MTFVDACFLVLTLVEESQIPPGGDEVVVPIAAKLDVARPYMFAITIEKPGGVVVSSRKRLPLLAKVEL